MKIKHLEFKNIGSFGEKLQTIEFPSNGQLVLIKGPSGVGKSTYLNISKLLLFGKSDGIPKNAVANRVNKNGYIKGIVQEGNQTYIIERGFQPTYLNIYKEDGTNLDMVGVKDAQAYINNEIVKMPYTLYSNSISLSLINFKSFLKMSPFDRREIIDRVFSLEIINKMFEEVKKDIKNFGQSINADNATLFSLSSTLDQANKAIETIKSINDSSISSKVEMNNNSIKEFNSTKEAIASKYKEIYKEIEKLNGILQILDSERIKKNVELKNINVKISLFNQDKCPTCGTSLKTEEFQNLLESLQEEKELLETTIQKIDEKTLEVKKAKNPYDAALQQLSQKNFQIDQEIIKLTSENNSLAASIKNTTEYQSIQAIIDKTEDSIRETKKRLEDSTTSINDLEMLQSLFSVDGVKKQIIDNYLPRLNAEIKDTLIRLNFPYTVVFDSAFNSHISDLGNEISAETLSIGELKRADLAVLCSIFKLIKRKYPSVNIFTLDEVLSSVDPANCTEILRFLKEFSEEMKINTYVITHINMSEDLFDECIEIYKDMRFSDINHLIH